MASGLILLVDDDPALRELYGRRLRADGFEVLMAADGPRALAAATRPLRLVLLDFRMPGMSGLEVLRRLKADPATADVPVVMLSNQDDSEQIAVSRAAGALAWWIKLNLAPAELGRMVADLLCESPVKPA